MGYRQSILQVNVEPGMTELAGFFGKQRVEDNHMGLGPFDTFINAYTTANPWELQEVIKKVMSHEWLPVTVHVGYQPAQISWLHDIEEHDGRKYAASGSYLTPDVRGRKLSPFRRAICQEVLEVYEKWGYTVIAGGRKDNPAVERWNEQDWDWTIKGQVLGHSRSHTGETVDLWVFGPRDMEPVEAVRIARLIGWPAEGL